MSQSENLPRTTHPTPPKSGRSAFWAGGFLFLCGITLGGGGAYYFVSHSSAPIPLFTPNATRPSQAQHREFDDSSKAPQDADGKGNALQPVQHSLPPLRAQGPIRLSHAILLNGGAQPQSNYFSHHLHIRMLHELLQKRGLSQNRIAVFSSDGEDPSPDQLVSSPLPMSWLFAETREDQLVNATKLINTTLPGSRMLPATQRAMRQHFQQLAQKARRQRKPSTVLLFVTDHGTPGRGPLGNKIELWNQQLTVKNLQSMMQPLGSKTRVISVMSQCYSGGFANLLYTRSWRVHGNRCGFFSTLSNREAYGCFPETAREGRVGHAYRMIRAIRSASTFDEAHRRTLITDRTPDVPIATSDIYLEDLLRRRARSRKASLKREVDTWLRKVWRRPPAWLRNDIQLLKRIQTSFSLPKHLYLRDVWKEIQTNRENLKELKQLGSVWKQVWGEVQRGSLMKFYQHHADLASAVEAEMNRPEIDGRTRVVGRRLYTAYARFIRSQNHKYKRLQRIHGRYDLVQKQSHAFHVYEAALLRVVKRLTRIAGRYYLHSNGTSARRRALRQLIQCENTPIQGHPFRNELHAEGPSTSTPSKKANLFASLKRLPLQTLYPSRLGIGFQVAPKGWHHTFAKTSPGAVQVNEVSQDSPAARAGLQTGDIIVAVGGQMLQLENEIRDIVMLSPSQKNVFFMVYRDQRFRTIPVQLDRTKGPFAQPSSPPMGMQQGDEPPTQGSPNFPPQDNGNSGGMPFGNQNPGDANPFPVPPHGFQDDPNTRVYGIRRPNLRRQPQRRGIPPVSLQTIDGKPIAFPAKKGATLLFFWATWCEGCKAMVPMLRRLQQRLRGQNMTLLAVTTDSPPMLRPFLQQWGQRFPFQVAIDQNRRLTREYRISTIPQLLLFGPDGQLLFRSSHPSSNQHSQLIQLIRKYARR